jgi:chorismate synthase
VSITTADVAAQLARRRLGYGRGARMSFEQDVAELTAGVRHGVTMGGPIALRVGNSEWPKWVSVMPRPGHADLAGMQKYGADDARPILERASARETAARVALGAIAQAFLRQVLGIEIVSHVVSIGTAATHSSVLPTPADREAIDESPVRVFDAEAQARLIAEVDATKEAGDTVGGVVEVLAYNVPPGLGSHVHYDRKLDGKLAGALMSIQAIKGVEIGDGFALAASRGSKAHDEIIKDASGAIRRVTGRSGGTEGGMSTGELLRVRAAMKPIATVPRALATIDIVTGEAVSANHQRSDVCAVPAAAVVAEAMVALVLAEVVLEKFGGDSVTETRRNARAYLESLAERGLSGGTPLDMAILDAPTRP